MKRTIGMLIIMAWLVPLGQLFAQVDDTGDDYFKIYEKRFEAFEEQASLQGKEISELPGYKDLLNWARFYESHHGENGSIGSYMEALNSYYISNSDVVGDFELSGYHIGPEELWPKLSNPNTIADGSGQGLVISLWANPNDANHIRAGTQWSGGLWETTDGGNKWVNLSDNERRIQCVSSIWSDSLNTDEIYVTTYKGDHPGMYSYGLFHTTDNGANWEVINCYVNQDGANLYPTPHSHKNPRKFLRHPINPDTMYLVTCYRLLQSFDGGDHWDVIIDKQGTEFYSTWANFRVLNDIEFDPVDLSTIYVSGPEAYRVENYGQDTINITDSLLVNTDTCYAFAIAIGAHPEYENKVYFTVQNYIGSDTSGLDWNQRYLTVYDKASDEYTQHVRPDFDFNPYLTTFNGQLIQCAVSPVTEDKVIVGGHVPMCYDLGNDTVFPLGSGAGFHNDNRTAIFTKDGKGREVAFFGTDGGITKKVNPTPYNYYEWEYIANDGTNGIRNLDIQGFDCSSTEEDIVVIGTSHDGLVLRKEDEWYKILQGGDWQTVLIDPNNVNNMYITRYATKYLEFSNDLGLTSTAFFEYEYEQYPPVLFFKPNDSKTLYVGEFMTVKEFDTDSLSMNNLPQSYMFVDTLLGIIDNRLFVREYGTSNDVDDYFYFATNRYFNNSIFNDTTNQKNCLLRANIGTGGELTYTDLSKNLKNGIIGGPVTGIAVKANDSNNFVYVSFGNVSTSTNPDEKKKVYYSADEGITWHAMAAGLPPEIPVNDIQYHKASDGLYLVNDVGVYQFDETDSVWVNITGDLPPMTFTQIRFSDMKNVMRIGSTGRGLWEALIPCGYEAGSINITGNVTWNDTRTIKKNIYVKNGGTLTVTGTLYMGESTKIVVERGGMLLLDGALLTSYCGGLWQGIEVWGNPKQASTLPYQGKVVLRNGSIIENAVNGIRAAKIVNGGTESEWLETKYAGGIIQAVESEFRNNKSDVAMYKYPATGYTFQNSSFFRKCEFVTDKMYFTEYDTCTHVKLSEVNMVKFHACRFKNESFEPYYGKGIYSFNSAFLVEGIDTGGTQGTMWDRTEFYNLKYGIYATAASTLPYADVRHSHFNDNERGLYLGGMSNARVTENEFELYGELEDGTYGLYLDYSTGYMVEENEFVSGIASNFRGAGIVVNNSGDAQNELYNNYFYRMETAILAQNCNRSLDYLKGLKIKCNDHDFNKRDILVIADSTCSLPGVSMNQGAPGPTDMQAGNTFSWFYNPLNPTDSDFDNIEDGPVTYYHHDPDSTPGVKIYPKYCSPAPIISLFEEQNEYVKEESCPSNITGGGGGGTGGDIRGDMADSESKADSTQGILAALVDGGDSEQLEQEVLQSMPPEAYDLYMSLMGKSPYLSDSVLMAALEKENVLPNVLIKDILVANPQAAKSVDVMEKVDEKSQPFTQEMLAEILLGKYMVAAKEKLEAQVGWYKHSREMALKRLKQCYLSDTLNPTMMDSLADLLAQENGLQEKYELAFVHLKKGQLTEATNLINGLINQFILNTQQQELYEETQDYVEILDDLMDADTNFTGLTEDHKTILHYLACNSKTRAGSYARNILMFNGKYDYSEPILLPIEGLKSTRAFEMTGPVIKTYPKVKLYPNPAKDYVIVEMLTGNLTGAEIIIYDASGKQVCFNEIPKHKQHQVVNLKRLPFGIYLVNVIYNGKILGTEKLTLTK